MLHMSPAHLQRVFTRWAGISPKRFHQYLTLGHAKSLLRNRLTTLQTSAQLGLSSGGRLHDLFLRWEAMTPGEYKRKGAGLVIRQGWFDSPFGPALLMGTERGICAIGLGAECGVSATEADLQGRWPRARFIEDTAGLRPWAESVFGGSGQGAQAETALYLMGSTLQIKVWEALLQIPPGRVSTYAQLAQAIGKPQAVRAVGTAVGRNPISWVIPCHRALRRSGGLGGYHWGLPIKRAMLAYETARTMADPQATAPTP